MPIYRFTCSSTFAQTKKIGSHGPPRNSPPSIFPLQRHSNIERRHTTCGVFSGGNLAALCAAAKDAGKRAKEDLKRKTRSWRTARCESRESEEARGTAGSRVKRVTLFYNDEFHITIGVVKLLVVRVDPGSWVVDIQHCVRLASALRAVAQG